MKRNIILFLTVLVAALSSVNVEAQTSSSRPKIAVYIIGDVSNAYKKVFGAKMVSEITSSSDYYAVERTNDFIDVINKEYDHQLSGAVSNQEIAKIGQQFGVQYVAVVDISEIFGELFADAKLIEVETALIQYSCDNSQKVNDMSSLNNLAKTVASGLIILPKENERNSARMEAERDRQEAVKRESERIAQLRPQAIQNLLDRTGLSSIQVGKYVVARNPVNVKYEFIDMYEFKMFTTIPYGWNIANREELNYILGNSNQFSRNHKYVFGTPAYLKAGSHGYNAQKGTGAWYVHGLGDYYIGWTQQPRSYHLDFYPDGDYDNLYILLYRPMFTESEIQAEINRIK